MKFVKAKKTKRNKIYLIASFLIIIGLLIIFSKYFLIMKNNNDEKKAIKNFYVSEEIITEELTDETEVKETKKSSSINYIGVLRIPKIKLIRGFVDPNSKLNDVKYNIQIIEGSDMPDVINGNFILAAHSGTASISYFKNLDKLEINDEVFIDYKNENYTYKVINKYDVEKTGTVSINKKTNKTTLTLITCRHNTNKQIVIIAEKI